MKGQNCQGCSTSFRKTKILPPSHQRGKRNTNCTWLYWELCKALKPPGSFPLSPSIIAFPIFSWISRFSQANSFQPFNISPMSEGRMALHGVAMETPAGWRWVREGSAREAEKPKCRSPTRILSSQGSQVFVDLFAQFRTLCQNRECGTLQRWEKGQMLSLVISLPPPKSLSDFFHGILLPALSTPSPFLRHWCSVQPEQGSFLVGCLGNMGCPERARATCRDFLGGSSAPSPVLGGIFGGGRINISYHSDCTGGLFLILSVHILHSWPQKQCSAPPSDSLSQGFLESTGLCFPQQALARALP